MGEDISEVTHGKFMVKIRFAIHWFRKYRFGINRHPWELSPDHYDEHDAIIVAGTLGNKTHRKFAQGELHLLFVPVQRSDLNKEAGSIGNARVPDGRLHASVWIPAGVYHSLSPAFAAERFQQMLITVRN